MKMLFLDFRRCPAGCLRQQEKIKKLYCQLNVCNDPVPEQVVYQTKYTTSEI